jgi:hypothetical protein
MGVHLPTTRKPAVEPLDTDAVERLVSCPTLHHCQYGNHCGWQSRDVFLGDPIAAGRTGAGAFDRHHLRHAHGGDIGCVHGHRQTQYLSGFTYEVAFGPAGAGSTGVTNGGNSNADYVRCVR